MKKTAMLLAAILSMAALMPCLTACNSQGKEGNEVYVSVPFEDKGFTEEEQVSEELLSDKFLDFPQADQSKLPTRSSQFSPSRLIENFNTVYATLAEAWNHGKMKDVVYTVNTTSDGVADTRGTGKENEALVTMYLKFYTSQNYTSVDSITHELTHVCQENYQTGYGGPDTEDSGSWIVEGMTDYSRYVYGMYPQGFELYAFSKSQSYTDSYRITARFFVWIEENICPTLAEQLNEALRTEVYTSKFFDRITGYSLNELWEMYAADNGKITDPSTGRKTSGAVYNIPKQ